ncbi:MAG: tetratricopeptide repeat protein [Syntrophobacteraceae bacterium]|jgi:tetratricopeptide (TPR) repeat protein
MDFVRLVCVAVFLLSCSLTVSAGYAQSPPGAPSYEQARHAMQAGNYQDALLTMQQAVVEFPENLELQYGLGIIYFHLGRLDESEAIFQALLRQDEQNFLKCWFDLAFIAVKRGKKAEALEYLRRARALDAGRADLESGIVYLQMKEFHKAVELFSEARSEKPELTVASKIHEAAAFSQLKKYDESKKLLKSLLKEKLTPEQREFVSKLLTSVKDTERNDKRWHVNGLVGYVYDSNPLFNPLVNGRVTQKEDSAQVSSVTGRYDLIRDNPWTLGAGYNHYNLTYFQQGASSIIAERPYLYANWNNAPFYAGLECVYGHYLAGDTSRANVYSLYPMFAISTGERWRTELRGWADWREFLDATPKDRLLGMGIVEYYLMLQGLAHIRAGFFEGVDDTSPHNAGGYTEMRFLAGTQWPVWKDQWFLDVSGYFIRRNYVFDPSFSATVSRNDLEEDLYVCLRGPVAENTQIMLIFQHVWNDSNIEQPLSNGAFDPFVFKRAIFSCMLVFDF